MNMIKLFLLMVLTCTTSLGLAAQGCAPEALNAESTFATTTSPESFEQTKKRYEDAKRQILAARPLTLKCDIARDIMAAVISTVAQYCLIEFTNHKKTQPWFILIPFFPILRYSIDKIIRRTDLIDRKLDTLISPRNLNLKALQAAEIDIEELEKKVINFSTKNESARWAARSMAIVIVPLFSFIAQTFTRECNDKDCNKLGCEIIGHKPKVTCSCENASCTQRGNGHIKTNHYFASNKLIYTSILIEFVALCVEMYTQSTTYKKSSRMKKIEQLKRLLEVENEQISHSLV